MTSQDSAVLDTARTETRRRFAVVTSGAVTGQDEPTGGFILNQTIQALQPYVMNKLGKSVSDDMRRMEDLVSKSDVDGIVPRRSGLFHLPEVSDYFLTEERGPGRFTARIDLVDALLHQRDDHRFIRKIAHVITMLDNPSLLGMMVREAGKK